MKTCTEEEAIASAATFIRRGPNFAPGFGSAIFEMSWKRVYTKWQRVIRGLSGTVIFLVIAYVPHFLARGDSWAAFAWAVIAGMFALAGADRFVERGYGFFDSWRSRRARWVDDADGDSEPEPDVPEPVVRTYTVFGTALSDCDVSQQATVSSSGQVFTAPAGARIAAGDAVTIGNDGRIVPINFGRQEFPAAAKWMPPGEGD